MLLLGLTGSIAAGKSTVSKLLSSPPYNLPIIDADVIARKVVEPGTPGYNKILAHFNSTTPGLVIGEAENGPLDRAVLGRRVFGNSPDRVRDRKVLNGIIHPLVARETYREVLRAYLNGAWAVVLDVPLLLEAGMETMCGGVVVVAAGEEVQMKRLLKRDPKLTEEDARSRVGSQWSAAKKVELAEYVFGDKAWVVDNGGSLEDLEQEVRRVVDEIGKRRKGVWKWVWGFPVVAMVIGLWGILRNWWRRRTWEAEKREVKAKL
ncbi:dephospho-CoA kinase-domain-containing protein [Trichophaea hybrida]|nr:dephospho-CoA kinase-domain-containing protein [Trichophaea hybrida]